MGGKPRTSKRWIRKHCNHYKVTRLKAEIECYSDKLSLCGGNSERKYLLKKIDKLTAELKIQLKVKRP